MKPSPKHWIGPGFALLGAIGIVLLAQQPPGSRTLVSWWILERALSVEKALPLFGLGAAIAVLSRIQLVVSLSLFLLGALLGFRYHQTFITLMGFLPNAADHLFLTGPISLVAVGLLLIVPAFLRRWLAPAVALVVGTMLAEMISLTDPTIDSQSVSLIGIGLGLWVITTTTLCVRSFYRDWFPVGLRILGSWLLAIGLLYGGTALIARPALPSLPDENLMPPPTQNSLPNLDASPSGPAPEELPTQP